MTSAQPEQDLAGKIYVVTGANSGIGFEASRNFASRGASVALICRSQEKGEAALQKIRAESTNENVRLFLADFSSMASVATVAAQLIDAYPKIHVLCNNAGGANNNWQETTDGFELTFAVNHLSGFLLTKLLMPKMLETAKDDTTRVVFTSSLGHKTSPLDFDNLNLKNDYAILRAYGRSKLMNLLTARELQNRVGDRGVICSSFHPGTVRTSIWSKGGFLATLLGWVMYPFMWSTKRGAETFIWLASSNDKQVLEAGGNYFYDCRRAGIAKFATEENARKLWEISEELVAPWV